MKVLLLYLNLCLCATMNLYRTHLLSKRRRGRGRTVVGFIATYAINANHHQRCEFEPFRRGALEATLCNKVCQ